MERYSRLEEEWIKKGPWTAEEDQVLVKFVNGNGPKDWSLIRSMGLLPRNGKSCRLRWVNKLRPNLKIGCKFTEEEERVVIDSQARIGNKWATIATCLPGRTDNDVKNFWSSRQKRLARKPNNNNKPPSSPRHNSSSFENNNNNNGKALADLALHDEVLPLQEIDFNSYKMNEPPTPSTGHSSCSSSMVGPQMLPLMPLQDLLSPEPISMEFSSEATLLPLLPESTHYCQADDELEDLSRLSYGIELEKLETLPDSFFNELPADMFD